MVVNERSLGYGHDAGLPSSPHPSVYLFVTCAFFFLYFLSLVPLLLMPRYDLRRKKLFGRSDEQEDELLSLAIVKVPACHEGDGWGDTHTQPH